MPSGLSTGSAYVVHVSGVRLRGSDGRGRQARAQRAREETAAISPARRCRPHRPWRPPPWFGGERGAIVEPVINTDKALGP